MDSKKVISAYARFTPHQMIELLGKKDITEVQLGMQVERKITILFTDIRDFTTLSENMSPQENFNFINSFLSQMEPLISVNDGIVDKFIGDAIMAIFPGCADDAINCALQMQKQLVLYNQGRKRAGYLPIRTGIGINTGIAMIGTVGGYNRMDGTVISDAVNLAARMESMTRKYDVDLLISENTYNELSSKYKSHIRFIDRTLVKGKLQPQSIYEVFVHDAPDLRQQKHDNKNRFEEAMAYYHLRDIHKCEELLCQYLKDDCGDSPARIYLNRCQNFERDGYHEEFRHLSEKIKWSDAFLIGESQIDEQHRKLVEESISLVEFGNSGNRDAYTEILATLKEVVQSHFRYEEGTMDAAQYPFSEHHKIQHRHLLRQIALLEADAANPSMATPFLTFRTQVMLVDWLISHTLKEDKHLGRHLAAGK